MKYLRYILIFFAVLLFIILALFYWRTRWLNSNIILNETNMIVKSSAFANDRIIPKKYTCDGQKINPPLEFSEVPKEAKSLVLIVDDPDTARGTFTHWTLWNIDPQTISITEGQIPLGSVEGANGTGSSGYIGPCPPTGTHRYFFKLYALDEVLTLDPKSDVSKLESEIAGHVLAMGQLVGLYSR